MQRRGELTRVPSAGGHLSHDNHMTNYIDPPAMDDSTLFISCFNNPFMFAMGSYFPLASSPSSDWSVSLPGTGYTMLLYNVIIYYIN